MTNARAPVVLLLFNRPDTTRRVFERIAAARPARLFLVADGPRPDKPGEAALCSSAREGVSRIDWDCQVTRLFSETNLGCRERVASGLDAVFSEVDRAIILEDDCLPDASFFRFCDELLERYAENPRVAMIAGTNFQTQWEHDSSSYFFSQLGEIWGWATWRRAWKAFDRKIPDWDRPEIKADIQKMAPGPAQFTRLAQSFDRARAGRIDTWDFQWFFSLLKTHGLAAVPSRNLVTNLGWRPDATHTTAFDGRYAELPTQALEFPLKHPDRIEPDSNYDRLHPKWSEPPKPGRKPAVGLRLRALLLYAWLRLPRLSRESRLRRAFRLQGVGNTESRRVSGENFLISELLKKSSSPRVIEVGAHLGQFSEFFMRRAPGARFHAIEPHPRAHALLEERSRTLSFQAHRVALAAKDGPLELRELDLFGTPALRASVDPRFVEWEQGCESTCFEATGLSLDSFARMHGIETIDLLRLNIDGGEVQVLQGASGLLAAGRVGMIAIRLDARHFLFGTQIRVLREQLPSYRLHRLLPGRLLPLEPYSPETAELPGVQTIVALPASVMRY